MSQKLYRVILALFTASVCVGAAEVLLRFFLPQNTYSRMLENYPPMLRKSDLLTYELVPLSKGKLVREEFDTTITINSQGYRGREFGPEKHGRFRILAIGDSFTFGYGVEDNESYPARLEQILGNEYHMEGIEIVNAGFAAGYFPDTYYLFLKERGLKLRPDLILIGFFIGNDIDHRNASEHRWVNTDRDGLPLRIMSVEGEVEDGRWVRRHKQAVYRIPVLRNSHLFQLLVSAGKGVSRIVQGEEARLADSSNPFMYEATYQERTDAAVRQVQTLFRAMAALAAKARIPLVVLMIPAREQVYPDKRPSVGNRDRDLEKPQRIFSAFFERERIPYLDLLPHLKGPAREAGLYFPYDMHWNAKGHDLGARVVAAYLVEHHFFKGKHPRADGGSQIGAR